MKKSIKETLEGRNYIDLFAGAGGTSLGFYWEKWEGILSIEKDPMAFETFTKNYLLDSGKFKDYKRWPSGIPKEPHDIEALLQNPSYKEELIKLKGKISLIMGGPPCQGFSVGGKRDGQDPRNRLVFSMLEVIELIQPPLVLIENVSGYAKTFKSNPNGVENSTATVVVQLLEELGYSAVYVTLNAADFGVPQSRNRIITFGISKEITNGRRIKSLILNYIKKARIDSLNELGFPTDKPICVEDAIEDLATEEFETCPDAPKFDTNRYKEPKSIYSKIMRDGISDDELPNSHRLPKHTEKLKLFFEDAHSSIHKGRLPQKFLKSHNISSRKKYLLDPKLPSTTITTHPDEFIHHRYPRIISIREMARIQSFPDSFQFHGRYTLNGDRRGLDVSRCAQVGNAVPPLLAKAIAKVMDSIIVGYTDGSITELLEDDTIESPEQLQLEF